MEEYHWKSTPLFHFAPWRLCVCALLLFSAEVRADEVDFDAQIAPLFAEKCLNCHGPRETKGNLNLSTKQTAFKGGDSGVVITPGKLDESYLWDRVSSDEMPPKHPLSADEKELLKQWIASGAQWGSERIDPFAFTTRKRAGYDWWALQPMEVPEIPDSGIHPVDFFVRRKLAEHNLKPSPPADRRTLIRRLSLDLLGLPPAPDEVEVFVADKSDDAYGKLVDRWLASPHYGERWARHWLDLARFGESQGFERDKPRDNAWRYRDWVIESLNADMPYDEFARLQLAGDVLRPRDAHAVAATGFLVAGPYDEVGQMQQSAAMRAVVRQDEMEDYIGTVGQTFLGLTVNCARCHDHKFDPILQTEYYRLASALSGVRPGERPFKTPETERRLKAAQQRLNAVSLSVAELMEPAWEQLMAEQEMNETIGEAPRPIARWTFDEDLKDEIGTLHGTAHGGAKLEDGGLVLNGKEAYVSTSPLTKSLTAKTLEVWLQLDNLKQRGGGAMSLQGTDGVLFDAIVFGEQEPGKWMAGSNNFKRTQSFQGPAEKEADKAVIHIAIVYDEQGKIHCYRNGKPYGQPYQSTGPQTYKAGQSQILFGLRHGTSAGGNRLLAGRIEQAQLYDRALSAEEVARTASQFSVFSREQLLAKMSPEEQKQLTARESELKELSKQIESLSHQALYAVTPRQPEVTHVLLRGNTTSPAEVVTPGGIKSLQEISADFGLAADAPEGERRKALAGWITNENNPLFARVIVNRLWHYHFGTGIVASPNDFGFNGSRPTHPELLDYLAQYLIDHHYSLKAVHKLIVTSEAYRQSSRPNPDAMAADADNRWLWRYSPQRLEAEVIRDAMLEVSGMLNPQVGGPSYRNFETFNRNSQFYIMQDRPGPEYHRRTIYRMWIRSGRNRLLDALDCPDPSTTTPARAVTTTPTQSLSLLNNSFVLRMSDKLAERIVSQGHTTSKSQVAAAYRLMFQRGPYPDELKVAVPFVDQHGLPALTRILFNTNEFLFAE